MNQKNEKKKEYGIKFAARKEISEEKINKNCLCIKVTENVKKNCIFHFFHF